jgi:hypothetical protein
LHSRDRCGVPHADGLIESGGRVKHKFHSRDRCGDPRADGLVESGGRGKHTLHWKWNS